MAPKHYRELIVWQKAMDLVEFVYKATAHGIRVDLHALGDKAIEEVLRIFRKVNKELKKQPNLERWF